jgi:hypothetical protein
MRTTLLITAGMLCASLFGQGNFATVYVTPPTNGCNGVWAVQITSVYCTPVSPYTFFAEPSGCVQLTGWGEQMGNFLMPLCALPCSLMVTTGDGVTCSGSTSDAPIGIAENSAAQVRVSVESGHIELISETPLPRQQLRVIDISGRLQHSEQLSEGQRWSVQAPSTPGVYIIIIESSENTIVRRFAIGR